MNETTKKLCKATGLELPADLAGFQLVCSSEQRVETIKEGDLLVPRSEGERWQWASGLVGEKIDHMGNTKWFRVYRELAVPKHDNDPSGVVAHAESFRAGCSRGAVLSDPTENEPSHTPGLSRGPAVSQSTASLPVNAAERKGIPIATGFVDYFPDAMAEVARVSKAGNDQHHPGTPLHWDKSKSTDEADALMRHFVDRGTRDTDGQRHSAKVAWRAMALLQREIDAERAAK